MLSLSMSADQQEEARQLSAPPTSACFSDAVAHVSFFITKNSSYGIRLRRWNGAVCEEKHVPDLFAKDTDCLNLINQLIQSLFHPAYFDELSENYE